MSEHMSSKSKSKAEIADQVGRLTKKLINRANSLSDGHTERRYRDGGSDGAPMVDHVKKSTTGDTEIVTSESNYGRREIVIKSKTQSGQTVHKATVDASDLSYINPEKVGAVFTKTTKEIEEDGSRSELGVSVVTPHRMFGSSSQATEIVTNTPELGYRYDDTSLKNNSFSDEQEAVGEATKLSAETLASIRGSIAGAEIAQRQSEEHRLKKAS